MREVEESKNEEGRNEEEMREKYRRKEESRNDDQIATIKLLIKGDGPTVTRTWNPELLP